MHFELFRRFYCYRRACCSIRLENGCLIFAIFNAMIVSSFLVQCVYYIIWLMVIQPIFMEYNHAEKEDFYLNLALGVALTFCGCVCFYFALLLCYGIVRKERSYIKKYFMFGVAVEFLGLFGTLAFIAGGNLDEEQQLASSAALIVCCVYPFLLLLLVRRTYKAMNKTEMDDSRKKLISHYNNNF